MPDPGKSLGIISARRKELEGIWAVMDEVQAKMDCNPPDSPQALKEDGLAHLTNVCWGSMEASISQAVEPIYNLSLGADTFLRFHTSAKHRKNKAVQQSLELLSTEHSLMLKRWLPRTYAFEGCMTHRTAFGLGVLYHPRPMCWDFEHMHPRNLIYPAQATQDTSKWPWCAVVTSLDIPFLLKQVATKNAGAGWRYEGIKRAIELKNARALPSFNSAMNAQSASNYYETYGAYDLEFGASGMALPAYIYYVREFDESISEHIIFDNPSEPVYLYSKIGKYKSLSHFLTLFVHEIGSGVLSALRGLGIKSLAMHDALDRIQNHEMDLAFMSGLIMQAADGASLRKVSEIVFGASVVIPSGFTVQQTSFSDTGASARNVKQDLRSQLAEREVGFGGNVDVGSYEKANRQFEMIFADKTQVRTFQLDRLKGQLDAFAVAHWARVEESKGADPRTKEMFEDLKDSGFNDEVLKEIRNVSHVTGSARGSKAGMLMGMDRVRSSYWGLMTEEGKLAFATRDASLSIDDPNLPGTWFKQDTPTAYDSKQIQLAIVENGIIHGGDPVAIADDDSDYLHLDSHAVFGDNLIAACEEGREEPRTCYAALVQLLRHCAPTMLRQPGQGHLDRLFSDVNMQQAATVFAQRFSQYENYRRKLEQKLQAQAQQEQQAAAPPSLEDKIKIQSAEIDNKIKVETHQTDTKIKLEKAALEMQIASQQAAATTTPPTANASQTASPASYPPPNFPVVAPEPIPASPGVTGAPSFPSVAPDQGAVPGSIQQ